jgi:orotidine-5'-phosphate decarboxylase
VDKKGNRICVKREASVKFIDKLLAASRANKSLLCVGLDPESVRFPPLYLGAPAEKSVVRFCRDIIEATAPYVCAFKPNIAFFEVLGACGMDVFQEVLQAVPSHIPVIVDAKRGDIGNSARNYASAFFDTYECDAVTVNPYMGRDSVQPFLAHHEKGVFLLCRTSNPGARDLQDLLVQDEHGEGRPLYEMVARQVQTWNAADNCGLVVGATYPNELSTLRALCPTLPILIPGVGAQGGDLQASVVAGVDAHGERAIVAVSRSILYAGDGDDYALAAGEEARSLRDRINRARSERYEFTDGTGSTS